VWVASVVVVVLVSCELEWVAVGWDEWVSWMVQGVLVALDLGVSVVD
jgi:hypothetical protein